MSEWYIKGGNGNGLLKFLFRLFKPAPKSDWDFYLTPSNPDRLYRFPHGFSASNLGTLTERYFRVAWLIFQWSISVRQTRRPASHLRSADCWTGFRSAMGPLHETENSDISSCEPLNGTNGSRRPIVPCLWWLRSATYLAVERLRQLALRLTWSYVFDSSTFVCSIKREDKPWSIASKTQKLGC